MIALIGLAAWVPDIYEESDGVTGLGCFLFLVALFVWAWWKTKQEEPATKLRRYKLSTAIKLDWKTHYGECVYLINPENTFRCDVYAVAGPDGYDPKAIDPLDGLPPGFRRIDQLEWELLEQKFKQK
jgi:hypothetical protein